MYAYNQDGVLFAQRQMSVSVSVSVSVDFGQQTHTACAQHFETLIRHMSIMFDCSKI